MSNGKPRYQKDPSMYACKRCKYPMRPKGIDCPNCGLNKNAVYPPVGGNKQRQQGNNRGGQQGGQLRQQPQRPLQQPNPRRQSPPVQQPVARQQQQHQQNMYGQQQQQGGNRGGRGSNNQFPIFGNNNAQNNKPKQFSLKNGANQKLHFTGENVALNRANLDPTSRYISPNQHATISFKNGKWYLKGSGAGATYVEVKGDMEIKNGDKIIFGNKFFTFEANE